jgi:CDP-diacylglycerol---glycerol-3-phosphate 3-phosphatidyltransferase
MLPVGRGLASVGFTPNALTTIGLLLNVGAGVVIASGAYQWGALAFLVSSAFDAFDGAVARAIGQATRFGAFFDSVADRYAEAAILMGLGWSLIVRGEATLVGATCAALVGSLLVSYARARAEGLGVECEVGLLQRTERILLLSLGLLFAEPLLTPIIWMLAVATNVTVVQRMVHVYRALNRSEGEQTTL